MFESKCIYIYYRSLNMPIDYIFICVIVTHPSNSNYYILIIIFSYLGGEIIFRNLSLAMFKVDILSSPLSPPTLHIRIHSMSEVSQYAFLCKSNILVNIDSVQRSEMDSQHAEITASCVNGKMECWSGTSRPLQLWQPGSTPGHFATDSSYLQYYEGS